MGTRGGRRQFGHSRDLFIRQKDTRGFVLAFQLDVRSQQRRMGVDGRTAVEGEEALSGLVVPDLEVRDALDGMSNCPGQREGTSCEP